MKAIQDHLGEIFRTILKLRPRELEEAETFKDLGIGSINAVQLLEAINSQYHLSLPTSILFECRNMDVLADYISREMARVAGVTSQDLFVKPDVLGQAPALPESSQGTHL